MKPEQATVPCQDRPKQPLGVIERENEKKPYEVPAVPVTRVLDEQSRRVPPEI
jgi:hypothetical protein